MTEAPDSVRKIVTAATGRAIQRCHEEGITLADFYTALLAIQKEQPHIGMIASFQKAFEKCRSQQEPVDRALDLTGKGLSIDADG